MQKNHANEAAGATADAMIRSILNGETVDWPRNAGDGFAEDFIARADYHGAVALLYERLPQLNDCPAVARDRLFESSAASAMWELRHQRLLEQVHAALAQIGVQPLLFKGTALAYSIYKDPWQRMRCDSDMLIPAHEHRRVHDALTQLGLKRMSPVAGDFTIYQASYAPGGEGSAQTIDLHWKLINTEVFSDLFCYEELFRQAVKLDRLSSHAMGVAPTHALAIACLHREIHLQDPDYFASDRLIWSYDIHLLASSLSPPLWQQVLHIARDKGLCHVCLNGTEATRRNFGTNIPEFIIAGLQIAPANERPAVYLRSGKLRRTWMNFLAVKGLPRKARFIWEFAFPSPAYMRETYSEARLMWLPWLYARRGFSGLGKTLGLNR